MAGCVTGKKMYFSPEMAEQSLIEAWVKNDYPKGSGPMAVYKCLDCGQYHLTSRGPMNETLSRFIKEGKLKLQKEANYWSDRFKK